MNYRQAFLPHSHCGYPGNMTSPPRSHDCGYTKFGNTPHYMKQKLKRWSWKWAALILVIICVGLLAATTYFAGMSFCHFLRIRFFFILSCHWFLETLYSLLFLACKIVEQMLITNSKIGKMLSILDFGYCKLKFFHDHFNIEFCFIHGISYSFDEHLFSYYKILLNSYKVIPTKLFRFFLNAFKFCIDIDRTFFQKIAFPDKLFHVWNLPFIKHLMLWCMLWTDNLQD